MSQYNVVMQVSLRDPSPQNLARLRSSIQSSLTGVNFNINTSNISSAQRSLRALKRTQDDCVDSANELAEALVLKGRNFFAYALASSAILRVGSALTDSVGEAIKFEKELSTIAQTTNSTLNSVKSFNTELISISKNYGISSVKVAEFTRTFAQAGLSIKDSIKAAELLSKTTLVGTFESTTETMEAMIATMSAFGRKAGDLEKDLASVNAISKQFAVENTDLVEVIKRSGGAFKAAGGSLEELLALFTSVRSYSREAPETIATGLNTVIGRLQRPKTIEYFERLGISLTDMSGNFIGMYQAIEKISSSLESIGATPGSIKFAEIVEQLGGLRQQPRVVPLLRNFEEAQKALNVATNNGISLDEDAIKAKQTLAFKVQELKRNFDALIVEIADSSSFKLITELMLRMANAAIELTRAISPLVPLIAALAGARVGLGVIRTVSSVGGSFRSFIKRADGGPVPGIGDGDTVPALLTPGEFVVKKKAVKKLGLQTLFRLNKFADGGPVGLTESLKSQGSNLAGDMTRATGSVIANLQEMRKVFEETVKHLSSASAEFVSKAQLTGIKDPGNRGYFSPGSTPQINITPKVGTVSTVEHEIGHAVDYGLAGGKGYASQQEGTLQNKLVAQARSKVEAFHKNAGVTGDRLAYLTSDVEIFADLFQKSSPEVRKILSSTTDAAEGMKKLAELIDQEKGQHIRLYADLQDYVKEQGKASGAIKQNPRHQIQRINNTVVPIRTVPPPLPPNARRRVGQSPTPLGPPAPQGPTPQGPLNGATPSQMAFIRNISGITNPNLHGPPALLGPNVPNTDPEWIANFLKQQNRSNPLSPDPANGIIGAAPTSAVAFGMSQAAGLSKAQQTFLNSTSSVNAITPTGKAAINGPKYGPNEPSLQLPKFTAMLGLATAGLATLAQGFVDTDTEFGRVASSLLTVVQTAGLLQTSLREIADIGIGDLLKVGFSESSKNELAGKIKDYSSGLSEKGGVVGRFGNLVGKYSNGIAKFGAAVSAATAAIGAIASINAVIDGVVDAEGKKKKAIEEGNIVQAGKNAAEAQSASDLNKFNYAIVAVLSAFGPLGTAVGFVAASALKLAAVFTPFGKNIERLTNNLRDNLSFLTFGFVDSSDKAIKNAESEAANNLVSKNIAAFNESAKKDLSLNTEKSRARILKNPNLKNLADSVVVARNKALASGDQELIKGSSEMAKESFNSIQPVVGELLKKFVENNVKSGKNVSFDDFEKSLDKNVLTLINLSNSGGDLKKDFENLSDIVKNEKIITENLNELYDAEQIIYRKKIGIESQLNNSLLSLSKAAEDSSQSLLAIQSAANPEALQSIGSSFSSQLGDINNVFDPVSFSKSLVAASKIGAGAGNAEILKGVDFAKQIRGPGGLTQKALELGGESFLDVQKQLASASENPQRQEEILYDITSGIVSNIKGAAPAVEGKLASGFKDIIKNAEGRIDPKAVEDLLVDALVTPAQELANKQKEAIEKQIAILNNYSASLRAINETDQKILESKLASLKGQQEFSNSLNEIRSDKPTSPFKMQFDSVMRQSQILSGEGDSSKLIGNADALSDAIKQTENRIYRLNERFQAGEALDKASVEQQEANKARLQKLNEALDEQINTYGEMKSALLDVAKAERDKAKQVKAELLAKVTKPIEERIKDASAEADANKILRNQLGVNVISSQFAAQYTGQRQSLVQEQQSRIIAALQRKAEGEGPEAEKAKAILNQISANSAFLETGLQNQFGAFTSQQEIKRLERRAKRGDKNAIEALSIINSQNAAGQNTQDLIIKGTTKKGLAVEAKAEEINKREAAAIKEREDVLKNRKEIQRGELAKTQQAPAQPQGLQEKDIAIMQQFAKSMRPIAESMKKFVEMPKEFTHKFDAGAMTVNIPAAAILQKLPDALKLVILDEINNEIGNIAKKVKEQLQAGG